MLKCGLSHTLWPGLCLYKYQFTFMRTQLATQSRIVSNRSAISLRPVRVTTETAPKPSVASWTTAGEDVIPRHVAIRLTYSSIP